MRILIKNIGINKIIGSLLLAIICFFVFLGNIKNIAKINSIIIPILIVFILYVGILNLKYININQIENQEIKRETFSWIIQSILYASYNLILVIPVLINLKDFIKSRKQITIVSFISSSIIFMLSIIIVLLLTSVNIDFSNIEMPIVYVIKNMFSNISIVYGIIILIAIFTTAVSIGVSFLNNVSKNKNEFKKLALFICIISVIVSNIGFSNLVKILFPMFGYMGILQIFLILKFREKTDLSIKKLYDIITKKERGKYNGNKK